jgi:hypothetical protein
MLGNVWHLARIGMADLERRRELVAQAGIMRLARGWMPERTARVRAWLGGQLIRAGEALRQVEQSNQRTRPVQEANGVDLWRIYPSQV